MAAEFTDFMNKRVDHFFAMFKELRSGSITYPEIAKRENVRPPINKVCQKLGVKKVAQMTSDEELLQAITSVVYDIEMKRRARQGEGGEFADCGATDVTDDADLLEEPSAFRSAETTKITTSADNVSLTSCADMSINGKNESQQQRPVPTKENNADLIVLSNPLSSGFEVTSGLTTSKAGVLKSYSNDKNAPCTDVSFDGDSAELLKLVLSIRAFNGRIQKALQQAQHRPGASPEILKLTTAEIQAVVKSLCLLIGCKRLDCTVSPDATTQAVAQYVQAKQIRSPMSTTAPAVSPRLPLSSDSGDLRTTMSRSPIYNLNSHSSETTAQFGLQIDTPTMTSPYNVGYTGAPFSPPHNSNLAGHYVPHYSTENQSSQNVPTEPTPVVSVQEQNVSPPSQSATANPAIEPRTPLSLDKVYAQFWELSYKLFLYVCNPYRHCQECLCVVEDLVALLEGCSELQSPLTALALDSVIQRAMYELSDKVSRPIDSATLQAVSASSNSAELATAAAPDCSVRNIEMCIALMSRNVSPICSKIREDYYAGHHLSVPQMGQSWCDKVLTLTRQLQELIAWSSPHCQARVPAYVPSRRQSFPANTVKDNLFTDRSLSEEGGSNATANANGLPNVPVEPKVIDFISALSPNSATEVVSALRLKDATLCEVLRQMGGAVQYAKLPHDLESSIQLNLHKVIHQSISGDCSIVLCGASVLGLSDAQQKIKLDFAALAAPYHTNFHDLSLEDQRADLAKFEEISELTKRLERAVEVDKLTEIAWKHLKACARDFHAQSQDYIIKLTSSPSSDNSQHGGGRGGGYNHHNGNNFDGNYYNHGNNSGNGNGNYHNKYVLQPPQYGDRNPYQGNNAQYPPSSPTSLPPELILEIAEDAERIRKIGDSLVEKYFGERMERTSSAPVINQILRKIEEVQETLEKDERERVNFVRKFSKSLDRVLKENRYLYVRMVSNKTRFTHINFEHHVGPHLQVSCNVIGCNPLPVQMTSLVHDYISLDRTGKVRDFLHTVKLFASSHHISDPATGYLSPTAWYVMALHVLLKHNLLPNLHAQRLFGAQPARKRSSSPERKQTALENAQTTANSSSSAVADSAPNSARSNTPRVHYTPVKELSAEYRERLQATSLLVLLDLFFRYYVEQVNLFTSVVTLREQGAVLPKVEWPANPVLWRISIEDPFEPMGSPKPYDLGCTLSRPGQLTTFKALRRAVYGIHSIMSDPSNDCHENISRLFSRVELINLARRSDYMGAVITASPAWVRPSSHSLLDNAEYVTYSRNLYKKFENDESLQLMFPSPREGSAAGFGSPGNGTRKMAPAKNALPGSGSLSARATEFKPTWVGAAPAAAAPNSARGGPFGYSASPMAGGQSGPHHHQQPRQQQVPMYKPQQQGGYPNQPYGGPGPNFTGSKPQMGGPYLAQHGQAPYPQGQDPHVRQGQGQYQHQQDHLHFQQGGPQRPAAHRGTVNLNNRQAVPHYAAPPSVTDQRFNRATDHGPGGGYAQGNNNYSQQQHQNHPSLPYDPTGAAIAASAEQRFAGNERTQQRFDPQLRGGPEPSFRQNADRFPSDRQAAAPHQQFHSAPHVHDHSSQNHAPSTRNSSDAPRYAVLEERYAKSDVPLSAHPEDRYHPGNTAPRDHDAGRFDTRYAPSSDTRGNLSARPEGPRYSAEEVTHSGSLSARYSSLENRYGYGASSGQQLAPQMPNQGVQQLNQPPPSRREPDSAPVRQSTGLPPGFKLDLQPRFAEDRYNYPAQDSARSNSATSSAYPSARGPDDRSYPLGSNVPGPVNIGNISSRRMEELSAMTSPRMNYSDNNNLLNPPGQPLSLSAQALQAQANEQQKQKPHKSPVVPLIPLEGISNFSGSGGSGGSSEYSNPLYSDRSLYVTSGRSDGLGDTGRTLVGGGPNNSSYYASLESGRSTGTQQNVGQQQFPSALVGSGYRMSAPNTARSIEANDDFRQGYYGSGGGGNIGGGYGGLSFSARSLEESLQLTERAPSRHNDIQIHPSESLMTNRLDYMGLEDLSTGKSVDLRHMQGTNDFDELLVRLNQNSHSHSQSQSSGGRASYMGDMMSDLPLNSARSGQSGGSARASSASISVPSEVMDFATSYHNGHISPRQPVPSRRESFRSEAGRSPGDPLAAHSGSGLLSMYNDNSSVPQRRQSVPLAMNPLDLQGLLGLSNDSELLLAKSGANAVPAPPLPSSSYLQTLFNDAPVQSTK